MITHKQGLDALAKIKEVGAKDCNTELLQGHLIEELLDTIKNLEYELQSSSMQSTNKISQLERELKDLRLSKMWLRHKLKTQEGRYIDMFNKHTGMLERQLAQQDKQLAFLSDKLTQLTNCRLGIVFKSNIKSILTWE